MRVSAFLLVLGQILQLVAAAETTLQVKTDRQAIKQTQECILLKLSMNFDDGSSQDKWECELQGFDAINAGKRFVELEGLDPDELQEFRSGYNTLFVGDGFLSNGKLIIPEGAERSIGLIEPRSPVLSTRRKKQNKRARSLAPANVIERVVLAVRIIANDSATTSSVDTIADNMFGQAANQINLVERYRSCSYGEMLMKPYNGTTLTGKNIKNGVFELTVPIMVTGVQNTIVRDQVEVALRQELGNLTSQFDHVMLCIPPGTQSSWTFFTHLGGYLAVYNNEWCNYPSSQVHVIGHHLLLNDADDDDGVLRGDQTCLMGSSYQIESTKMCFNAAKSWQLGWYGFRRANLDFSKRGGFRGQLIGVSSYAHPQSFGKYVLVRTDGLPTQPSVYVGFNHADGINIDTNKYPNQVIVYNQSTWAKSFIVAKLGVGQEYNRANFTGNGKDLIVKVNSIDLSASPPVADVDIFLSGCEPDKCGPTCNSCCVDSDCTHTNACVRGTCNQRSCSFDTSRCPGRFNLNFTTDQNPTESSWEVMDQCTGQKRLSSDPYTATNYLYSKTEVLGQSWYKLTVKDSQNNGMTGTFSATFDGVDVAAGGGNFGKDTSFFFGTDCSRTLAPIAPTPAPTLAPVVAWTRIFSDTFEGGFTIFKSGGNQAIIVRLSDGSKSLQLSDDKNSSVAFTKSAYTVSSYIEVQVRFKYYTVDADPNEKFFLDWSIDGITWNVAGTLTNNIDFRNYEWKDAQISWLLNGVKSLRLRFRCGFSDATEKLFIDSVVFQGRPK